MNSNEMLDEQKINLIDFAMSILEQWRGWVLLGLICALLLPGVKCVVDMKEFNSSPDVAEIVPSTEQIILSSNPGVVLNYYVTWQQFKNSYDESIVMNLDAANVRRLNLEYFINCSDAERDSLTFIYSNLPSDEAFVFNVADSMGLECDYSGTVAELIEANGNGGGVLFSIILPEDADEKTIENAITSYLSSLSDKLSSQIEEHNVVLISYGVITSYDQSVVDAQSWAVSNIYSWKKTFLELYKTLTDAEKSEVNEAISKMTSGELSYQDVRTMYPAQSIIDFGTHEDSAGDEETADADAVAHIRPVFSIKYALLGFAVGVFLYVGCSLAILIMIIRFRNGEEAASLLSLRSYGDIYEYPYHGLKAFLHDKRIYCLRHKKTSNVDKVAQAISAKADFNSNKKLTCLVLGDAGKRGMKRIEEIVKKAFESGISIELKKAPNGLDSISEEEISKFYPVLITVVSGKTRPVKAADLLIRLKEYNIPVFGMTFIEM